MCVYMKGDGKMYAQSEKNKGEVKQKKMEACLEAANIYASFATKEGRPPRPPYIAIGLFACELYMKALLMKRDPKGCYAHTHNLLDLFQALPALDQQKIEEACENHFSEKPLLDFLAENAEGFEKWRYDFETKEMTISHFAFLALINALREHCKN